jgi:hypothetical protein
MKTASINQFLVNQPWVRSASSVRFRRDAYFLQKGFLPSPHAGSAAYPDFQGGKMASIRETIREWLITLHADLVGLREETQALRVEVKAMTQLILEMNQQITELRKDLDWIKERKEQDEDEDEPRWKM